MPLSHILIALAVVACWGLNFVFIKLALVDLPPFTLAAARFLLVAFPAVFFIPRPKVPWKMLAGYGLTSFALQFGFLFLAMRLGMSAGLASMILQVQVFFTIGLSMYFFNERPTFLRILGAVISFLGVVLVGFHADKDTSLLSIVLLLFGALSWASGNVFAKSLGKVNAFALVVWGGIIAFPALLILAFIVEGKAVITSGFNITALGWWSVAYIVYISTYFGYSLWNWLLKAHSAAVVAPFTLLVPVFGFLSSILILHEEMALWKIHAGILVVTGLCINLYASRRRI